ncbi:MAG: hypothetical protein LCH77_11000 [Actinobacteria bacterium]|uniref:Uncharacterized protein n=1 Tax=Nostocoides veronense TaxID=330836 RepID=A0ABP4Y7W1_9MICO|nr:hypothetical protein [Actinomycetota bacterium]
MCRQVGQGAAGGPCHHRHRSILRNAQEPQFPESAIVTLVPIFIGLIALLVFGGIIIAIFKGIQRQAVNKASPQLARQARVTAKRSGFTGTSDHRSNTHTANASGWPAGGRPTRVATP